jgi:general secretion pathway protein L
MSVGAMFQAWLDGLAGLLLARREARRARQGLLITPEHAQFVVRPMGRGREPDQTTVVPGTMVPPGLARLARRGLVMFELNEVVVRRIQVPAQAREFLPGIVRNQIERLSPWQGNETVYGFDAAINAEDAATLDVRVLMTSRGVVDAARDQVAAIGLAIDRIVASDSALAPPVALWSQLSQTSQASLRRTRWLIGAAIAAVVVLSLGVSGWAVRSAASLTAELDTVYARQRQVQAALTPQALASLPPAQRAWVSKQTVPAAVLVLEALSRALPDQAYLTELALENGTLRITGLADDAPALLAPLERSGFFSDVHFFAPTMRNAENARFVFHIQARVEPRLDVVGE